ncbi:MAG: glycosyltransferase family 8 protein, partial [Akkermansia sp.]
MRERENQTGIPAHVRRVSLCAITDNGYCVPTIVMLASAKANKRSDTHYRVHVIQSQVSRFYIDKLRELSSPDFEIIIHSADASKYEWVRVKGHVPVTAMLKLDIAGIIPDEKRMLYIDGDAIVKGDLSDLFYTDLEGAPIGAVRDIGGEHKLKYGERIGVNQYFNTGVLLIDLELFRREGAYTKMLERQRNAPEEWLCHDQDNINTFFNGRIKELECRYNALLPMCYNEFFSYSAEDINRFYGTAYSCMEEAEEDAVIIHFAGEGYARPWSVVCGSFSNVWRRYYDISPIGNQWLRLHVDPASICAARNRSKQCKIYGTPSVFMTIPREPALHDG